MYELLHELANNLKLKISGNFKKILEMSGIKTSGSWPPKFKTLTVPPQKCKNADLKHFTEKPIL